MAEPVPEQFHTRRFTGAMTGLYFLSLLLLLYFLIRGAGFYLTPFAQRIHAEDYRILRSAGGWGHTFGVAGSSMMIFMLLYSLRKRWRRIQNRGRLNHWLQVHIYFGVVGPLFIVLHSAFKVEGLVAVSFWSMVAVAFSGVLGRYLYLQIPRNIFGEELDQRQVQEQANTLAVQMNDTYVIDGATQDEIQKIMLPAVDRKWSTIKILVKLMLHDLRLPIRLQQIQSLLTERISLSDLQRHDLLKLIRSTSQLNQKLLMWNHVHALFHYWHVIHRPFAYIMYLFMLVHVGVAVWLGYSWIF